MLTAVIITIIIVAPILVYCLVRLASIAIYRSRLDYERERDGLKTGLKKAEAE